MWCFLFLHYRSLTCCSGHLLPARYFLQLLPLSDVFHLHWKTVVLQLHRFIISKGEFCSKLLVSCWVSAVEAHEPHSSSTPKNLYHCKGVSPPMHAWGIAWLLLKVFRHFWDAAPSAVVHWNLTDFYPGTATEKGGYMTQAHSKLDWWGGWLPLLPVVVEHNHKPGIFPHDVASSLSDLFPKSSLLRRAGHLLCSYSIHCPSVLPHDEQGCSLPYQNIGLAFRTSIWAQYNKESFFPSTIPGPCWNAIWVGG